MKTQDYEKIKTRFALIAIYAYRENYGFDSAQDSWKNKGSSEVVIRDNITIHEALSINEDSVLEIIKHSGKCLARKTELTREQISVFYRLSNASIYDENLPREVLYSEHTYIDYLLDERSENTLKTIRKALNEEQKFSSSNEVDYHFLIFNAHNYGISESTMKWGIDILKDRKIISYLSLDNHYDSNIEILIPYEESKTEEWVESPEHIMDNNQNLKKMRF